MARKLVAFVFLNLLGLALSKVATAADTAATTSPSPSEAGIGNEGEEGTGAGGFAEAGPVDGPIPKGQFQDTPTDPSTDASSPPKKNGAYNLEVSAFVGAAAAGFSLFYF